MFRSKLSIDLESAIVFPCVKSGVNSILDTDNESLSLTFCTTFLVNGGMEFTSSSTKQGTTYKKADADSSNQSTFLNDGLQGNNNANTLNTTATKTTLHGLGGNDTLIGGATNETYKT
jgi:Ca2+-binding RTX toxin-like protein